MDNFVPQGGFDATNIEPKQGGQKHPVGMFPFVIKTTDIVSAKDNKSGMFRVTFETPVGTIDRNYNLWHENAQTVEIAQSQLSALCHVTGIFKLNWPNKGRELVGSRGTLEVGWQKDNEPGTEKGGPTGGYVEVKKVFDANGNEPGKVPSAPQPQQSGWGGGQQQQPQQQHPVMQQQPNNGGWGNNAPQQQPQQQAPSWGTQPQQPQNNTPPWGQK